jgi:excisionase family DNA binding protein
MPPMQKPLPVQERAAFTVGDACLYTSISKTRIYRYMDTGQLRFKKLGQRRVLLREDLDLLIKPNP